MMNLYMDNFFYVYLFYFTTCLTVFCVDAAIDLRQEKYKGQVTTVECGKPSINSTVIVNGAAEKYGDSPWHVTIYDISKKSFLCGGTIISPYLILSASHCFNPANYTKSSVNNYEVIVSKVTSNYSTKDNSNQKSYKVKDIRFSNKGYATIKNHYAFDIAVIILAENISMSSKVLPACVDWSSKGKYSPEEGALGKVVGLTRNGKTREFDENLITRWLPFISHEKCVEMHPSYAKPFITPDKLCAGFKQGKYTELSDFKDILYQKGYYIEDPDVIPFGTGAGILYQENSSYYIRGILSLKPNNEGSVGVFTDLNEYISWISSIRDEIEKDIGTETTLGSNVKHARKI